MKAAELLTSEILPLKPTDTCETAMVFMHSWKVFHLPVSDNGKLIGYVKIEDIETQKHKEKIGSFIVPLTQLYLLPDTHFFSVVQLFTETKFSTIAVCDSEGKLLGIVSVQQLVYTLGQSSLLQPGAIVVIQMAPQDYSLSELTRIIEYNDCKVISVIVNPVADSPSLVHVSLKLNKQAIQSVIQTLQRYNYSIESVLQTDETEADLYNRYDWLIKYLNT
jgi:acetoin utilization protein AcuB